MLCCPEIPWELLATSSSAGQRPPSGTVLGPAELCGGVGMVGCGGMWWGVVGCGGVWWGVVGCGGVWWDVVGCGGVWWGVV